MSKSYRSPLVTRLLFLMAGLLTTGGAMKAGLEHEWKGMLSLLIVAVPAAIGAVVLWADSCTVNDHIITVRTLGKSAAMRWEDIAVIRWLPLGTMINVVLAARNGRVMIIHLAGSNQELVHNIVAKALYAEIPSVMRSLAQQYERSMTTDQDSLSAEDH